MYKYKCYTIEPYCLINLRDLKMKVSKKVTRADGYFKIGCFFLFTSLYLMIFLYLFLGIIPIENIPFIVSFIAACYFLLLFEVTTK